MVILSSAGNAQPPPAAAGGTPGLGAAGTSPILATGSGSRGARRVTTALARCWLVRAARSKALALEPRSSLPDFNLHGGAGPRQRLAAR